MKKTLQEKIHERKKEQRTNEGIIIVILMIFGIIIIALLFFLISAEQSDTSFDNTKEYASASDAQTIPKESMKIEKILTTDNNLENTIQPPQFPID